MEKKHHESLTVESISMQLNVVYIGEKKVRKRRFFFHKIYLNLDTWFNKWKSNITFHFGSGPIRNET